MMRAWLLLLALLLLAGCSYYDKSIVQGPTTARPLPPAPPTAINSGAIYQPGYSRMSLFDDRRARNVGDILTINLQEKTTASKQSNTKIQRTTSAGVKVNTIPGWADRVVGDIGLDENTSNKLDGQGQSNQNNLLTGTITVTVLEVLSNGNLVVAGEKQVAINQGTEFVRFSGVVNPSTIDSKNSVSSTQVADARIEYKGKGTMDEAQTMGWLSRFFLSVLPF